MNFGIVCSETLLDAWSEPDHPLLSKVQGWSGRGDLFCWVFDTNPTASTITIIAESVSIRPLP
jgi:hypothetical protein